MSSLHHHIDTIVFCYHILNEKKVPLKSHELQNYMYMDRYIYNRTQTTLGLSVYADLGGGGRVHTYTSSTAQGGGGSFKNRKP
jgi:hypothetical protein